MDSKIAGPEQRKVLGMALVLVAVLMAVMMVLTNKGPCPRVPHLEVLPGEASDNKLAYCLFERRVYSKRFTSSVSHVPLGVCAASKKEALVLMSRHQSVLMQKQAACRARDTSLLGRMMGRG